jgi:histidine triad (HIT) family protein
MSDCIFCKIVEGKIPSTKVYEDEKVIGFKDLRPQAAIHQLFIHKAHTKDINELSKTDPSQLADLFNGIRLYTEKEGLTQNGFRVVTNLGAHAGQTVFHTHLHVLGGEPLGHFGA